MGEIRGKTENTETNYYGKKNRTRSFNIFRRCTYYYLKAHWKQIYHNLITISKYTNGKRDWLTGNAQLKPPDGLFFSLE